MVVIPSSDSDSTRSVPDDIFFKINHQIHKTWWDKKTASNEEEEEEK